MRDGLTNRSWAGLLLAFLEGDRTGEFLSVLQALLCHFRSSWALALQLRVQAPDVCVHS